MNMTREEFIDSLQSIIDLDVDCKALVYFALKKDGVTTLKKANIQEDVWNNIADATIIMMKRTDFPLSV